jgi:hypothetical protein
MGCVREIAVLHVQDDGTYSQWFTYQQRKRRMVVDFIRSSGYSWIPLTFLTSDEHDHNVLYLKEVYFKKEQEIIPVFENEVIRGKNLWKRDDTASRGKYSYSFRLKKNMRRVFKKMKAGDLQVYDLYVRYSFDDEEEITIVYPYAIKCYTRSLEPKINWWY